MVRRAGVGCRGVALLARVGGRGSWHHGIVTHGLRGLERGRRGEGEWERERGRRGEKESGREGGGEGETGRGRGGEGEREVVAHGSLILILSMVVITTVILGGDLPVEHIVVRGA